jgi:hypothetical protein
MLFKGIRRISHTQGRIDDAMYWASQPMAARVIAGWDLAEQDLMQRSVDVTAGLTTEHQEKRTTFTLRRVRRSPR